MAWFHMLKLPADEKLCRNIWSLSHKLYHSGRTEALLRNTMTTRNRAWSVQRTAFDKLRIQVLLKPKFHSQVILPVGINLAKTGHNNSVDILNNTKQIIQDPSAHNLKLVWNQISTNMTRRERVEFFKEIEPLCCHYLRSWDLKAILLVMDLFYQGEFRAARFYREALTVIDHKLDVLEVQPEDITQLLFYASFYRSCPISLIRDLESLIASSASRFSCSELSLICHAFFSTNTCLHNFQLIQTIAERTLKGLRNNEFHDRSIGNVLKALRHTSYQSHAFYQQIAQLFCKEDIRNNMLASSFAAMMSVWRMYISIGFVHLEFSSKLFSVASRMLNNDRSPRFKDLSSLVWGSQMLQLACPPQLLTVLRDVVESDCEAVSHQYPEKFVEAVLALVLAGQYPVTAVSLALSPEFLSWKETRPLEQTYQLLLLDVAVRVYCPDYRGHRLSKEYIGSLTVPEICDVAKELAHRRGLASLLRGLQAALGGEEYVHCHCILHHSKLPDLEMRFVSGQAEKVVSRDKPGSSVTPEISEPREKIGSSITEQLLGDTSELAINREEPVSLYLRPDSASSEDTRLVTVKVLGWHQYAANTASLLGVHACELELLRSLGYHVITVTPVQAVSLEQMTEAEIKQFIQEHIYHKLSLKEN